MKDNAITLGSAIIVMLLVVTLSMSFRWHNAKNGYQEYTYVETEAPYTKAANPIVGATYYFSDMYKVTYSRGKWPFVSKTREHWDRKFMMRKP
jgi:hypothetical protein